MSLLSISLVILNYSVLCWTTSCYGIHKYINICWTTTRYYCLCFQFILLFWAIPCYAGLWLVRVFICWTIICYYCICLQVLAYSEQFCPTLDYKLLWLPTLTCLCLLWHYLWSSELLVANIWYSSMSLLIMNYSVLFKTISC